MTDIKKQFDLDKIKLAAEKKNKKNILENQSRIYLALKNKLNNLKNKLNNFNLLEEELKAQFKLYSNLYEIKYKEAKNIETNDYQEERDELLWQIANNKNLAIPLNNQELSQQLLDIKFDGDHSNYNEMYMEMANIILNGYQDKNKNKHLIILELKPQPYVYKKDSIDDILTMLNIHNQEDYDKLKKEKKLDQKTNKKLFYPYKYEDRVMELAVDFSEDSFNQFVANNKIAPKDFYKIPEYINKQNSIEGILEMLAINNEDEYNKFREEHGDFITFVNGCPGHGTNIIIHLPKDYNNFIANNKAIPRDVYCDDSSGYLANHKETTEFIKKCNFIDRDLNYQSHESCLYNSITSAMTACEYNCFNELEKTLFLDQTTEELNNNPKVITDPNGFIHRKINNFPKVFYDKLPKIEDKSFYSILEQESQELKLANETYQIFMQSLINKVDNNIEIIDKNNELDFNKKAEEFEINEEKLIILRKELNAMKEQHKILEEIIQDPELLKHGMFITYQSASKQRQEIYRNKQLQQNNEPKPVNDLILNFYIDNINNLDKLEIQKMFIQHPKQCEKLLNIPEYKEIILSKFEEILTGPHKYEVIFKMLKSFNNEAMQNLVNKNINIDEIVNQPNYEELVKDIFANDTLQNPIIQKLFFNNNYENLKKILKLNSASNINVFEQIFNNIKIDNQETNYLFNFMIENISTLEIQEVFTKNPEKFIELFKDLNSEDKNKLIFKVLGLTTNVALHKLILNTIEIDDFIKIPEYKRMAHNIFISQSIEDPEIQKFFFQNNCQNLNKILINDNSDNEIIKILFSNTSISKEIFNNLLTINEGGNNIFDSILYNIEKPNIQKAFANNPIKFEELLANSKCKRYVIRNILNFSTNKALHKIVLKNIDDAYILDNFSSANYKPAIANLMASGEMLDPEMQNFFFKNNCLPLNEILKNNESPIQDATKGIQVLFNNEAICEKICTTIDLTTTKDNYIIKGMIENLENKNIQKFFIAKPDKLDELLNNPTFNQLLIQKIGSTQGLGELFYEKLSVEYDKSIKEFEAQHSEAIVLQ